MEYIYILQLREFINSGENVYKIGRTSQKDGRRIMSYPPQSKLHLYLACEDSLKLENNMIRKFNEKFERKTEYGREYYKGELDEMISEAVKLNQRPRERKLNALSLCIRTKNN